MTRYAVDRDRGELIAVWGTGLGDVARTVGRLPARTETRPALRLAESLTWLSRALWRCYTHPASAADSLAENTEGWRRSESRAAFSVVPDAVLRPNLPADGLLLQSYDPVVENAHAVGRALYAMEDEDLTDGVVADIRAELEAVEQAECGDLTARGRQAVLLTRADASPVQVAAADTLLHDEPLGCEDLFTDVDPTAAAVAAAHWLQAAATVVAEHTGREPTSVILDADDIEALPVATPVLVLDALEVATPREVVLALIRQAMDAAEGRVTDIDALAERIEEARATAAELAEQARAATENGEIRVELGALRVTPLDPMRPARDLLEDLLAGIRGCWLVFEEHADLTSLDADALEAGALDVADTADDGDDDATEDADGSDDVDGVDENSDGDGAADATEDGDGADDVDDTEDESDLAAEEASRAVAEAFVAAVRTEAARTHQRLG